MKQQYQLEKFFSDEVIFDSLKKNDYNLYILFIPF